MFSNFHNLIKSVVRTTCMSDFSISVNVREVSVVFRFVFSVEYRFPSKWPIRSIEGQ